MKLEQRRQQQKQQKIEIIFFSETSVFIGIHGVISQKIARGVRITNRTYLFVSYLMALPGSQTM
jgi:hypothetical protein